MPCAKSSVELVWKIVFPFILEIFHFGIFHTETSVLFHTMSCSQVVCVQEQNSTQTKGEHRLRRFNASGIAPLLNAATASFISLKSFAVCSDFAV